MQKPASPLVTRLAAKQAGSVTGFVLQQTTPWLRYSGDEKAAPLAEIIDSSAMGSHNTAAVPFTGDVNDA